MTVFLFLFFLLLLLLLSNKRIFCKPCFRIQTEGSSYFPTDLSCFTVYANYTCSLGTSKHLRLWPPLSIRSHFIYIMPIISSPPFEIPPLSKFLHFLTNEFVSWKRIIIKKTWKMIEIYQILIIRFILKIKKNFENVQINKWKLIKSLKNKLL
jgi:hypothetical protein